MTTRSPIPCFQWKLNDDAALMTGNAQLVTALESTQLAHPKKQALQQNLWVTLGSPIALKAAKTKREQPLGSLRLMSWKIRLVNK